ncbi:unnamed protein product [Musa acuminata subsp. malaccensis]|uniref:(wild Malaysian banana) hypothetical protein n=1 Tax=Musa acuminata subsp. malaccensis TaxID=214687 RepID=A0A804K1A9_MUSAM|nr:unnamed protein product [Musa acuminata subsp. malaccensis]
MLLFYASSYPIHSMLKLVDILMNRLSCILSLEKCTSCSEDPSVMFPF